MNSETTNHNDNNPLQTLIDTNQTPNSSNNEIEPDTKEIIQSLEQDGYKKVNKLYKTNPQQPINMLVQIMEDGFNEFEQKNGRKMTYAEMRAAYG
jgi:hypothetical protein